MRELQKRWLRIKIYMILYKAWWATFDEKRCENLTKMMTSLWARMNEADRRIANRFEAEFEANRIRFAA